VIGINNAIEARAHGIGFAIPINVVKAILPQLREKGTVARGYIGIAVEDMDPEIAAKLGVSKETRAPFVVEVNKGGPADKAGLKPYDVILTYDGQPVRSNTDLVGKVTATKAGKSVPVKIARGDKELALNVEVAKRPNPELKEAKKERGGEQRSPSSESGEFDMGMTVHNMTPEIAQELDVPKSTQGVVVVSIDFVGPAAAAGIMPGDIIVEVDRKSVKDAEAFNDLVHEKKEYLLRIRRPAGDEPDAHETYRAGILDLRG
jgi:serine protease Do